MHFCTYTCSAQGTLHLATSGYQYRDYQSRWINSRDLSLSPRFADADDIGTASSSIEYLTADDGDFRRGYK